MTAVEGMENNLSRVLSIACFLQTKFVNSYVLCICGAKLNFGSKMLSPP